MSDPLPPQQPALPDPPSDAELFAIAHKAQDADGSSYFAPTLRGVWDASAAHFAADRAALTAQVEGLEAVIAEALTVHPQAWPDNAAPCTCSVCAILSASPSSVVAGIKAEALEEAAADWHQPYDETTYEAGDWLAVRAAAIREAGGQQL